MTNSYTDTASHWAKNYIEYCSTLGIVAGKGDGTFDPEGDVTVAEAAKMVLVALGYNAPIEGYVGGAWQINVDARANPIGLYEDLDYTTTSAALTRDNAAQMLYNALDCDMVRYDIVLDTTSSTVVNTTQRYSTEESLLEDKFDAVKVEGVVVANEMANLASTSTHGSSLDENRTRILVTNFDDQEYYGNSAQTKTVDFATVTGLDELGRSVKLYVKKNPTSTRAQVLGSVILSEDNTVVTSYINDELQDIADDNDLDVTGNTVLVRNYGNPTSTIPTTKSTAGVEKIFIDNDDDNEVDYILENTYAFGKVTSYVTAGDGSITIDNGAGNVNFAADDADDVLGFDDVARDDYVISAWIGGKLHVSVAETVTGVLDGYKENTSDVPTKLTVDGEDLNVSHVVGFTGGTDNIIAPAEYTEGDLDTYLDTEAVFFLGAGDYVVAIGDAEATAYNYALVLAKGSSIDGRVKVALPDGTIKAYDLNENGNAEELGEINVGEVYRYSLNSSDEIRLTKVYADEDEDGTNDLVSNATADIKFTKGRTTITGTGMTTQYANASTVFFYADPVMINTTEQTSPSSSNDAEIDDVNIYAGYANAPTLQSSNVDRAEVYRSGDRVVAVVFTGSELTTANVDDLLYIADRGRVKSEYQEATAIIDGEPVDIQVELGDIESDMDVYTYTIDDGIYSLTPIDDTKYDDNRVISTYDETNNPTGDQYGVYSANSDTVVIGEGAPNFKSAGRFEVELTADTVVIDNSEYQDDPVVVASVHDGDYIAYAVYSYDGTKADELKMIVIENPEVNQGSDDDTDEGDVTNASGTATLTKGDLTNVTPDSIDLNSRTGNLRFAFAVDSAAGRTVNYAYEIRLNGEWAGEGSDSKEADAEGLVTVTDSTTLNGLIEEGDEVTVKITSAVYVDEPLSGSVTAEQVADAFEIAKLNEETEVVLADDANLAEAVEIPTGMKLVVNKDFTDAHGFTGEGTLKVNGTYSTDGTRDINNVEAEAVSLTGNATVKGTLVTGDVTTGSSATLTIEGTATVNGAVDQIAVENGATLTLGTEAVPGTDFELTAETGSTVNMPDGSVLGTTGAVSSDADVVITSGGSGLTYTTSGNVTIHSDYSFSASNTFALNGTVVGAEEGVTITTGGTAPTGTAVSATQNFYSIAGDETTAGTKEALQADSTYVWTTVYTDNAGTTGMGWVKQPSV